MLKIQTAALIIIGNEILSGRTIDINSSFIAQELTNLGINLIEIRIIKDIKHNIIETIQYFRSKVDLIFTTGGIGPTHDDITSEAIAAAFGRKYLKNDQAAQILLNHYKDNINEARMKMAYMPENAILIDNPISKAPGFIIENLYVLPGVPHIMQAMFNKLKETLPRSAPIFSKTEDINIGESIIAKELEEIQLSFPDIEIGSYPFEKQGIWGTSIVIRSINENQLIKCHKEIVLLLQKYRR